LRGDVSTSVPAGSPTFTAGTGAGTGTGAGFTGFAGTGAGTLGEGTFPFDDGVVGVNGNDGSHGHGCEVNVVLITQFGHDPGPQFTSLIDV